MTATVLDRVGSPGVSETQREPVVGSRDLDRPPTLFGEQSDPDVVHAGYDLARRAIGYALENVPLRDAIGALVTETPSRDALHMAFDYLAYTRFDDVPRSEQVEAFFLVEDARAEFDRHSSRRFELGLGRVWRRLRAWFDESMRRMGELADRTGRDPFGGPLLPV